MNRREFIGALGGVAACPIAARAQQAKRQIGLLMASSESDLGSTRVTALREGLHALGWSEDKNITIHIRWAGVNGEAAQRYANELIALQSRNFEWA